MNGARPTVGLLGASGMVGSAAAAELRRLGVATVRLGARRVEGVRRVLAEEFGGRGEAVAVDATDPAALDAFCDGCQVVLNCAGPTYLLRETVAAAAVRAGAHAVDVAGDDPAWEGMVGRGLAGTDRSVVFSAGTLPGLSSLVPRWLVSRLEHPSSLTAWVGGREPCSPVVAADLMLSLTSGGADGNAYGEALAAWRAGRRRPRALRAAEQTTAPFFPGTVAVTPSLSSETERLAQSMRLHEVDWFNVHPGAAVRTELQRLPGYLDSPTAGQPEFAVRLARAANLDLAGRSPFYLMVFTVRGRQDGTEAARTVLLRTASSYRLTGVVGALTARAVLDGRVPAGLHYACDVLDPAAVIEHLRHSDVLTGLTVLDHEPATEQGAL